MLSAGLAVTASVQLVGVYLVFSSLIMPALAVRRLPDTARAKRLGLGWGLGAAGYALGLALSALMDWPSGAVVVWTMAACAVATATAIGRGLPPRTRTDPHQPG